MYKVKNLSACDPHNLEDRINGFLRSLDELYLSWDLIDIKITYVENNNLILGTVIYNYTKNDTSYDNMMKELYQEKTSSQPNLQNSI